MACSIAAAMVAQKPAWSWDDAARAFIAKEAYDFAEALIAESDEREVEELCQ